MTLVGLEPTTKRLKVVRSCQLSYNAVATGRDRTVDLLINSQLL